MKRPVNGGVKAMAVVWLVVVVGVMGVAWMLIGY